MFIYTAHTIFCLIWLHPVNRFPAVSLNSLQISSSGSQIASLADLRWLFGAIVCRKRVTTYISPRASATMKCWSLIHGGEIINPSADLKEKCQLDEGSLLEFTLRSNEGELLVDDPWPSVPGLNDYLVQSPASPASAASTSSVIK